MKTALVSAIRSATDLVFPPKCVHCGADGNLFCERCVSNSTELRTDDVCRTCALPSRTGTCETCFASPPALHRTIAAFANGPEVSDAVTALKYKDIRAIAPRLGMLMPGALPASVRDSADVLVPVPLSSSKMRQRGYNQSELLARQVSKLTDIKMMPDLLFRTGGSAPQARAKSIDERADNVRDAFTVTGQVDGLNILLIDDVMTTGATLNSCATALKLAGAARVDALVLAREL